MDTNTKPEPLINLPAAATYAALKAFTPVALVLLIARAQGLLGKD